MVVGLKLFVGVNLKMQKINQKYIVIFIVTVTIFLISSFIIYEILLSSKSQKLLSQQQVIQEAKAHMQGIIDTSSWNSHYGGVYVKAKDGIKPNPYVRDNILLTDKNETLIKINPAWMTRQISEISNLREEYHFKMTSLKLLNPLNKADKFEERALKYFENNLDKKYFYIFDEKNKKFNFMGALSTTKACLECHKQQDYKVGDIRGGIRVSVPLIIYNQQVTSIEEKTTNDIKGVIFFSISLVGILYWFIAMLYKQKNEQDTLLSLFDISDSVLFKWNNDDIRSVAFVSNGVFKLLGYSKSEFESGDVSYESCIYGKDLKKVTQEVIKASKSDVKFFRHTPYRVITKANKIKWVLDNTILVKDKNNKIINYIGYISDITEQKEKEEQLLQQSKLAQMGDMVSMIAHQWRQPLNAISATGINLSLLSSMKTLEDKKVQESSEFIQDQCQKMSQTIDTFMNFVKPAKESKPFKPTHTLEAIMQIMGTQLTNHNITVNIESKNDNISLEGYEDLLEQVIINLLSNSRDAFEDIEKANKFINITIDVKNDTPIITIEDNAGGIPVDIQEKIFNPYFTTKEQGKGTGIGLYMSMDIMKKSFAGDLIYLATEDGSRFEIIFRVKP